MTEDGENKTGRRETPTGLFIPVLGQAAEQP